MTRALRVVLPGMLARLVLVALLLLNVGVAAAQDQKATTVQAAARAWLTAADRLDGNASWKSAGARFRGAIDAGRWTEQLRAARTPWGAVQQRASTSTRFADGLPDGTKGEFAHVQYRTAFERHAEGHESLTLEHEPDGGWRVVGYFVR